ncbi:alkaline phosphatase D family protein [Hyalangium rubrum]|uniref:Alkaline phosphatase D family protein n=1 Tax=Hyalangium rubrum TaxID=3103134 RepID=A0ABU5HI66_9BACT|nr:alkaline phosphatase D family protein [Hyalangium sp. s54d21]MDY7233166.1 alkaline phosphatase D family protein [Hyalangium sp. s54d21]
MAVVFPVKPVTVGPLVGHTTDTTVRLWGRGERPTASGGQFCYGVAQVLESGSTTPAQAAYFKLRPEDDFTGTVDFQGLRPGKPYAYRMGYFFSDVEQHLMLPALGLQLEGAISGVFRTARAPGSPEFSLVFGSCRHPTPGVEDGLPGVPERGDRIFGTILEQVEGGTPTDALLMVGDQIYADVRADDRTFAQYCARHRQAFIQPNLRRLMARVPTYMAMDDHEIADNWSMDRLNDPKLSEAERAANKGRFLSAIEAYRCYQVVHSPALKRVNEQGATNAITELWYTFQSGPAHFFVMDVRTERFNRAQPPQLISARQMQAVRAWMAAHKGELKFVVTAVPFYPDVKLGGLAMWERNDKWAGFMHQRQQLLDFMRDEGVRRTVFLSGDVHVSLWAELTSTSRPDFRAYSIISSAFNAPAFTPPEFIFEHTGILDGQADYVVSRHGGYTSASNFTRLTWKAPTLRVEVFERKGKRLHVSELNLDG